MAKAKGKLIEDVEHPAPTAPADPVAAAQAAYNQALAAAAALVAPLEGWRSELPTLELAAATLEDQRTTALMAGQEGRAEQLLADLTAARQRVTDRRTMLERRTGEVKAAVAALVVNEYQAFLDAVIFQVTTESRALSEKCLRLENELRPLLFRLADLRLMAQDAEVVAGQNRMPNHRAARIESELARLLGPAYAQTVSATPTVPAELAAPLWGQLAPAGVDSEPLPRADERAAAIEADQAALLAIPPAVTDEAELAGVYSEDGYR